MTEGQKYRAERNRYIGILLSAGVSQRKLSSFFGLCRSRIASIWKELGGKTVPPLCAVVVLGPDSIPIVRGESLEQPLTDKQYRVIEALIDAGPDGLSLAELQQEARCPGARDILKRLRKEDKRWRSVIHFPGTRGGGGYRLG